MVAFEYDDKIEKFAAKNPKVMDKFNQKFEELCIDISNNDNSIINLQSRLDITFLKGQYKGKLRLRDGNYRAIFKYYPKELLVYIFKIGKREDIYEK